jgi:TRAP-type mannitol/chloroaromatic compound transport system substrate-binding protein
MGLDLLRRSAVPIQMLGWYKKKWSPVDHKARVKPRSVGVCVCVTMCDHLCVCVCVCVLCMRDIFLIYDVVSRISLLHATCAHKWVNAYL